MAWRNQVGQSARLTSNLRYVAAETHAGTRPKRGGFAEHSRVPYCRHFAELAVDRIEQVLYLLLLRRHALEPTLCATQPPQRGARRRQRHPNLVATAARVCLLLAVLGTPAFERGIE